MLRSEMYTNGEYLRNNPDWDEKDAVYKVNWLNTLITRNNGPGTGCIHVSRIHWGRRRSNQGV